MFGGILILTIIGVMVSLVVVLAILRSQGGYTVAVTIIGIILSLLAIFMIVVAGTAIYQFATTGPHPPGMPQYYRCTVQVVQDGTPLEGATVMLHPIDKDLEKWGQITGVTDAKGNAVMKIMIGNIYEGAFKGEYKVTVQKVEMSGAPNFTSISYVDEKFTLPYSTPLELKVSRKTKATVDLGPVVRIERDFGLAARAERESRPAARIEPPKSPFATQEEVLKVVYPCKITILRNGVPVPDAEIELEPTVSNFAKYAFTNLNFTGTTNAQGIASIVPVPTSTRMQDREVTFPEGVPADTFRVLVTIKDEKDFDLRTGKRLEEITISDEAFEREFELNDYKSPFSR